YSVDEQQLPVADDLTAHLGQRNPHRGADRTVLATRFERRRRGAEGFSGDGPIYAERQRLRVSRVGDERDVASVRLNQKVRNRAQRAAARPVPELRMAYRRSEVHTNQ